jgi:Uncharacterised nucleotidyltransferase
MIQAADADEGNPCVRAAAEGGRREWEARRTGANLAVSAMASEVLQALGKARVGSVVLKGPPLTALLYRGEARVSGDVDLLVREDQLGSARDVLRSLGFARVSRPIAESRQAHAEEWARWPTAVTVDLHVTLVGVKSGSDNLFDALIETAGTLEVGGVPARVPMGAGLALVLALHAAAHGSHGAKSLHDLALARCRLPERSWTEARALAVRLDALDAYLTGLALAEGELAQGASRRVEVRLRAGSAPCTALGFERLARTQGLTSKARYLMQTAFPAREVLLGWHPLARSGRSRLALAYVLRIGWLARWSVPGFRAWFRVRRDVRSR